MGFRLIVVSLENAKNYLAQLNLSFIIDALCSPHYPLPRWTKPDAEACSQLYKNFLWLNKLHLPKNLVPTKEIDEFWHQHILHTKEYLRDCKNIFGFYFHHNPTSPDENPEKLIADFLVTKALYLEAFKTSL